MTKIEFREQFKRLRMAGYRLPVFDGITVDNVLDEWYGTFGGCTVAEFSEAIDRLKRDKTDTFWPATGELWAHVYDARKARRIRLQSQESGAGGWRMSEADSQEFLAVLRATRDKILSRRTMPSVSVPEQVEPDHVLLEREDREDQS